MKKIFFVFIVTLALSLASCYRESGVGEINLFFE